MPFGLGRLWQHRGMEALLRIEHRPPGGDVGQLDPDQGRALLALLLPDVQRVEVGFWCGKQTNAACRLTAPWRADGWQIDAALAPRSEVVWGFQLAVTEVEADGPALARALGVVLPGFSDDLEWPTLIRGARWETYSDPDAAATTVRGAPELVDRLRGARALDLAR